MSEVEGDRLSRLKDYAGAVEQYNRVEPLTVQARGKRALAEFELGLFAEAHSDASHVLSVVASSDNSKPFEALVGQCEKRLFEQAFKLNHHSGDFMTLGLEVVEEEGGGRGLRSARRLLAGELLVIASPLVEVKQMGSKPQALEEMALRLMKCTDESVLQCVNDLDDGSQGEGGMDVKQVLKRNCFQLDSERFALYHMPSLVNHSCSANVCLVVFGSTLVLRVAARDIPPHTPIHIRYFAVDGMLVRDRERHTMQHWQFTCRCRRCQVERAWSDLSGLKAQEQPLCDLFFQSHGNPQELAKAWLQLDDFIAQVEQTKLASEDEEQRDYLRANFLAAYQVYRACCEAVGGYSAAVCAQDRVLQVFASVDPCSFEHLKTLAVCDLFANHKLQQERGKQIHAARIRAHQIRYGKEPLLVQHSLEQTQTATLTKSPEEWSLKL